MGVDIGVSTYVAFIHVLCYVCLWNVSLGVQGRSSTSVAIEGTGSRRGWRTLYCPLYYTPFEKGFGKIHRYICIRIRLYHGNAYPI